MRIELFFRLAFLYIFIFQSLVVLGQNNEPDSVLFDFTNYNEEQGLKKLEGNCDFYWQQLINPSDIAIQNDTGKYVLKIPGSWTKLIDKAGNKFPANGYGTYHFKIKVPNQTQIYGFKLYSIFTAYKFYANGTLIAEVGTVGKNKDESIPKFSTKELPFSVIQTGNESYQMIDVWIQVSNFHHRRAGAQHPMYFGTMQHVIKYTKDKYILNLLLIGIILIIGFNHVLMYLLRRSDVSNLMFGILSVVMILRNISTDERILINWFPQIDWELLVRLDNFSGFATIALFAYYFYFIFRSDFPKVLFYVIMGIGISITLLVFGTKAWYYGQFRMVFEIYIGLGGLIITFGVLLRAAFKNRPGGWISFIGMLLLYLTAINDVLYSMGLIYTAYVAQYGIAAFMLLQSFLLTRKSAMALKNNEVLASELEQEKQNLESRIEERTSELTKQAEELKKYREEQERQNFVNKNLNIISDVMHLHKENLNTLADQLLATLVKCVNGTLGAMYLKTTDNDHTYLKLLANWGLSNPDTMAELDVNEGITGQCFNSGKEMFLDAVPEKYFAISSGLGTAAPKSLALFPLINDEKVIGVVEIATFKVLEAWHKEFLQKALLSIAAQLQIVKLNADTQLILSDYKNYKEELQRKEDEYRELQLELSALREANAK